MASEIAVIVAGMRGVAEYSASRRAASMAAAISKTLLRPSSTEGVYHFRFLFATAKKAGPDEAFLSSI